VKFNLRYVLGISVVSALGGLLFGYDWVVIGGAKPFYERFFEITSFPGLQGLAMSSALIGCVAGAVMSGWLSEMYGRKGSLIMAAVLFILSALGTGLANAFGWFMTFRVLGGIGIGVASAISPVYIAEVSPAGYRGRLVSLNQLNIVIGILLAQIINFLIARPVPEGASDTLIQASWNGQMGWRWMFWAEVAPASLFLVLLFLIPESPRWLSKVSRWDRSELVLQRIGGEAYARTTGSEIANSLKGAPERAPLRSLVAKDIRPMVLVGVILAIFQQWCGINVVFNYAEEVFSAAGYEVTDILFNIVITGIVNLVFTFVAIRMVDRWGRKRLMITGSLGLAILYSILGLCYCLHVRGIAIVVIIVLCIAAYAMTLAPVTWVVLSEIFPNRVRGVAMASATTMLWVASSILVITFPYFNRGLNAHGTFWLYAGICLAGFLFILFRLPETKGKSLEEIERVFKKE